MNNSIIIPAVNCDKLFYLKMLLMNDLLCEFQWVHLENKQVSLIEFSKLAAVHFKKCRQTFNDDTIHSLVLWYVGCKVYYLI